MLTEHTYDSQLAAIIRDACIQAAIEGYQTAAMDGLCRDGAWEAAINAMTTLDIEEVLDEFRRARPDQRTGGD